MSWIRSVSRDQADPALRELYNRMEKSSAGRTLSNLWQNAGLDRAGLEKIWALYRELMGDPSPLTRAQAEAIAVVVSATNGCGYCVAHHAPKLAAALGNEALARAVALDYRSADLPARDRVLLDHAVALTCEPEERTSADIERLREYGFDDAAILKATEITAYYNLTNRLASGLGVMLEPEREPWEFGTQE